MAFDFYDCNNDGQISEFDIFKVLKTYGNLNNVADKSLFNDHIQSDILIMLKLIAYKRLVNKQ